MPWDIIILIAALGGYAALRDYNHRRDVVEIEAYLRGGPR